MGGEGGRGHLAVVMVILYGKSCHVTSQTGDTVFADMAMCWQVITASICFLPGVN